MSQPFQTNANRVHWYLDESADWLTSIDEQLRKIEKLSQKLNAINRNGDPETNHFKSAIVRQSDLINALNSDVASQQHRLQQDHAGNQMYDIDALFSQDILRERLRDTEKHYIELRASLMKYLSTVL